MVSTLNRLKRVFSSKKKAKKYVSPLECLNSGLMEFEKRIVPAVWRPSMGPGGTDYFATGIVNRVPNTTNWCDSNGNQIVQNATTKVGPPGKYLGMTDRVAQFGGTVNGGVGVQPDNSACSLTAALGDNLLGLSLLKTGSTDFNSTFTLTSAGVTVSGALASFNQGDGTIDVKGHTLALSDAGTGGTASGGTIKDSAGGGSFAISATSTGWTTELDLTGADYNLNVDTTISGAGAKFGRIALGTSMTGNLKLGHTNTITASANGEVDLFYKSANLIDAVGCINGDGTARTSYGLIINAGKLVRGVSGDGTNEKSVAIAVPVRVQNAGVTKVNANYQLDLTNSDGVSYCYYQTDSGSELWIDNNGGTAVTMTQGLLDASFNIDINGGALYGVASVMQLSTAIDMIGGINNNTLNIDSGALFHVAATTSNNGQAGLVGYFSLTGNLKLNTGSELEVDGNGTNGLVDTLNVAGTCTIGSSVEAYFYMTDATAFAPANFQTYLSCTTLTTTFATFLDNMMDTLTHNFPANSAQIK